jgi:hypothetical protein
MKKDKLSGADKFYGYSTKGLIARTKKEKKAAKDFDKSRTKPLDQLTSEEIGAMSLKTLDKKIKAFRRQKKIKKIERRKIEIEGKNIIEKFFNIIAIIWMDTPVGMVISIALIVLLAIIINGGSMDSGAPSFFTDTE